MVADVTDTVAELEGDAAPDCFALLRAAGMAVEPAQIQHRFWGVTIDIAGMLCCAKDFNFQGRVDCCRPAMARGAGAAGRGQQRQLG